MVLCETTNTRLEQIPVARRLVWLGAISYSVYLVHFPLIHILSPAVMHIPSTTSGEVIAGFVRLPMLVGLGYLFHLAFERPFMLGHPRAQRQVEVAAATSPAP